MIAYLTPHFPLLNTRVHEVCGAAGLGFAFVSVCYAQRSCLWIRQSWQSDHLLPEGMANFCDPSQVLLAQVSEQTQGLAVMEEALRDGALGMVVIELDKPLDLTAGRRLQLAAQAGRTTGLCLIRDGMGSNAAQTRWRCDPVFDPEGGGSTLMHWSLIKNKSGTLCDFYVRWTPYQANPADRLAVVSPPVK